MNISRAQLAAMEADGWVVESSVWTAVGEQCLLRREAEEKFVTVTDSAVEQAPDQTEPEQEGPHADLDLIFTVQQGRRTVFVGGPEARTTLAARDVIRRPIGAKRGGAR